jgi:EAL domain-containing protein (putative c-di-GMP-specific phosphodiesterase class I)
MAAIQEPLSKGWLTCRRAHQPKGRAVMTPSPLRPGCLALAARDETGPDTRIERSARIRFAVAQALAQGRVDFHFQPVVRADSPGFPAFHELLVRVTQPSGEILPAGAFMPLIEEGALGRAIDRLALARAVALLEAQPGVRLSVNMSPLSMGDEGWLEVFEAAAARSRPVLGRLILEMTETEAIRDVAQTREFMDHVRAAGVAFALDDFGAGATGFRHFREMRFDIVKIDGAFVQGIAEQPDSRVLVECLIAVARHFDMMTVAERVETEAEAALLTRLGVDCLQGYRYGRPAPTLAAPDRRGARQLAG